MKTYILLPEGRGISKLVEDLDTVVAVLETTRVYALKALDEGTPLNGYFIDEALTDKHGIPIGDIKKETDSLWLLHPEKKYRLLKKWLEKKEQARKFWEKEHGCRKSRLI